tara:strand:+ start:96 stop:287 length:192 start_codon:yes stop_codon:yes gene_type:complete
MKPGWKTTEFWVTVISLVLASIASSGLLGSVDDPWPKLLALIAAGLVGGGYTISRGLAKMNQQ